MSRIVTVGATALFAGILCATPLSLRFSPEGNVSLSADTASAVIGRPLTPMSVAGVNRRAHRRAYRHGYYGYGYGPNGYYGSQYYRSNYGAYRPWVGSGYGYGYVNRYGYANRPWLGSGYGYGNQYGYGYQPSYGYRYQQPYSGYANRHWTEF